MTATPVWKVREIVDRLLKKQDSPGGLDEFDSEDLKNYQTYLTKYENDLTMLGVYGVLAWGLWQEVQGQRKERFSSIGDIEFQSLEFLFKMRGIDEEDQEMLYSRIMHIDHLVRAKIEKRKPARKGGKE